MEHEAADSDKKVAEVCDLEDHVMAMFSTTVDAGVCEIHEHQIRQGVDDLGGVVCRIIVLVTSIPAAFFCRFVFSYLFAPLEGASYRVPEARLIRRWVRNRR